MNAVFLALAGAFIVLQARGQGGYLEIVGPPAMRFEAKTTNEFLFAAKFPMRPPKPEPTVVSNAVAGEAPASNAVVKISEPETATKVEAGDVPASTNLISLDLADTNQCQSPVVSASADAGNSVDTTATAGDLLTTTPQMIMQYLKPDPNGGTLNPTNRPATAVFVPAWTGFMPALMQFPAESKSESRATYISK